MTTVLEFCKPSKTSPIPQFCSVRAILARAATLLFILASLGYQADAQSLGFVVNSADGTVTVLANATTTLPAQAFSEDTLQTVTFPTQAGQSAVQLVATAVAPAAGSKTPPTRLVYVTDQKNNELWSFDISTISQANAAAKPVSITAGSCSPLFTKPGAIAIATPGSSIFAYVANSDGTVSIINLATSSCVAKTAALGTITGTAVSPDNNEVFILTSTVGAGAALWEINTTATSQTAAQINAVAVKLANPVSIAVQNDSAGCYFLAIGDKGNANLFLAAVGPGTDPNCPANVTPTTAEIVDGQTPIALQGVNPVSVVSTIVPGSNPGSIYVADAGNNELWEIDCSASSNPPVLCNVNQSTPLTLTNGATPTTVGISLAQTIGLATAAVTHQYLYVAGTSSSGSVVEYADVAFQNQGLTQGLSASSLTLGNAPQGLIFTGPDPKDPPVAWFMSANGGGTGNFQGSTWVMPTSGLLTILGSTIADLSSPTPALNLNFGTTAANGQFGSSIIYCAPFGGGTGETTCPADSGVAGANAVGGQSSTTSGGGGQGGQPTALDLPASTVFTITLESCSEAGGCPTPPSATDTVLTQQISAGGVCTLTVTPSPNTGLNNVAIGQPVNAQISCVAPASGVPPSGDNLTATLRWTPTITAPVSCTPQTCTLSTPVGSYIYENATMSFASNTYTATGTYPLTISGTDTTEKVPIFFTGTAPTITVNGPSIAVSPTGSAAAPIQVQLLATQPFAGTLSFSSNTPTVNWTLTDDSGACAPTCGTITNAQATLIPNTLDYNISATYNAPSGLIAGTITLTVASEGANAKAYIQTTASVTNPPPACSITSPPTSGQTGLAVTVTLTCTAPAGDSLSATVNWSDGEPQTLPGTADGTGAVTITFTHTYATPANYAVSVTSIQDTTTGLTGTPPAALSVTIYQTPTVTTEQTAVTLVAGQSITFPVSFSGGPSDAGITLSNFVCQNQPTGVSCAFSPSSVTLDANGNSSNTLQLTVSLAAPPPLSQAAPSRDSRQILLASIWGLPLFGLVILGAVPGYKERKRRRQVWCALLFIAVLMCMPACSSVSQHNVACPTCAPPGGPYPITVTGSSANPQLQASTVFQLTVAQ